MDYWHTEKSAILFNRVNLAATLFNFLKAPNWKKLEFR